MTETHISEIDVAEIMSCILEEVKEIKL